MKGFWWVGGVFVIVRLMNVTNLPIVGDVDTIVNTMSKYFATVIKTGNSYALRIPKEYVDINDLHLGQKVKLPENLKVRQGNVADAVSGLQRLAEKGSMKSISDPVAWQRAMRDEVDAWSEVIRDTGR
jgi:antitoxin component of MazEF toxin-antitoxin module